MYGRPIGGFGHGGFHGGFGHSPFFGGGFFPGFVAEHYSALDLVMADMVIRITRIILIIQVTNKIHIILTIPIKMRKWKRRGEI